MRNFGQGGVMILMSSYLIVVVSSHYNDLPSILDDPGLSSSDCLAHRNALKMNCYVLTRLVEAFETESFKRDSVELSLGGRVCAVGG